MALHRTLNQAGLGGNYTTWHLWNTLLAAGWTIDASGSGTGGIYSATLDVFDHAINPVTGSNATTIGVGVGDEHWGNATCWGLFTSPDGSQIVIQRRSTFGDSSDDDWAYAYSPGGNFSTAAASATVAPVATSDQYNLHGVINSSWVSIHASGGVANIIHIAADDAASPSGFYGAIMIEMVATNTFESIFMIDDLRNVPSGGLYAAHAKMLYVEPPPYLGYTYLRGTSLAPNCLVDYGGGSEAWRHVPYCSMDDSSSTPLYPNGGAAPSSGEVPFPIPVGLSSHGGFAGLSRWLRWPAVDRGYNDRSVSELLWYVEDVLIQDLPDGVTIPASI